MSSQGAVFKLTLRDDRFDNFHTASDYLRSRLDQIRVERANKRFPNVQPTFLDIERTHTLYIHAAYRPYVSVASEYARVKAAGDASNRLSNAGGVVQFTFPIYGHFTSDMALHVRFKPIGSKTATAPTVTTPFYRFCAYPGVRMFRKIELRSDQVLIDDYTPEDVMFNKKFFIASDSVTGWDRCVGQQDVREASYFSNGYTAVLNYQDGPQTPKLYQEGFDMYVPLNFWFCRDANQALLNDLIPNSQRTVVCRLAPLQDIVQAVIPNGINPGTLDPVPLPFESVGMEIDLYVNGLYVNPEIHDIFASRVGFSLIRVHRRQTNQIQSEIGEFLLDQLKFPAEYLMTGFRSRSLITDFDRWYLMGTLTPRIGVNRLLVPAMIWNAGLNVGQLVIREAIESSTLDPIIDTIGITAHGIEIFPKLPGPFYNAYLPIKYAENSMVVSPNDANAFLITFCLYPGKYAPSGYYNLSAGRELYLNYGLKPDLATNIIGGEFEMVLSMSALNFLVRKGDKLSLRYAM
jgi:hypothetical protein